MIPSDYFLGVQRSEAPSADQSSPRSRAAYGDGNVQGGKTAHHVKEGSARSRHTRSDRRGQPARTFRGWGTSCGRRGLAAQPSASDQVLTYGTRANLSASHAHTRQENPSPVIPTASNSARVDATELRPANVPPLCFSHRHTMRSAPSSDGSFCVNDRGAGHV
jgi:hypothetical protein